MHHLDGLENRNTSSTSNQCFVERYLLLILRSVAQNPFLLCQSELGIELLVKWVVINSSSPPLKLSVPKAVTSPPKSLKLKKQLSSHYATSITVADCWDRETKVLELRTGYGVPLVPCTCMANPSASIVFGIWRNPITIVCATPPGVNKK